MDLRITDLYVYGRSVDFRKSLYSLSLFVSEFSDFCLKEGTGVLFYNKRRNHLKLLHVERHGFCLWQKKLGKRRFDLGSKSSAVFHPLSSSELTWLRSGLGLSVFEDGDVLELEHFY